MFGTARPLRVPLLALAVAVVLASSGLASARQPAERPPASFEVVTRAATDARLASARASLGGGRAGTTTVEWLVQPFYAPTGHMSVRVGDRVYSFGPRGWDVAEGEAARRYLLDNRFFRRQVRENQRRGHDEPAYSAGFAMEVPRDVAEEFVANIEADRAAGTPYALLTNNCQSALLRLFPRRGGRELARALGPLARLSPRMTIQRLRERAPYAIDPRVRLYPVDPDATGANLAPPTYLGGRGATVRELGRIGRSVPAMLHNQWLRAELGKVVRGAIRRPPGRPR